MASLLHSRPQPRGPTGQEAIVAARSATMEDAEKQGRPGTGRGRARRAPTIFRPSLLLWVSAVPFHTECHLAHRQLYHGVQVLPRDGSAFRGV